MATRTIVELIDDLDGSKAEVTLHFAVEGVEYEIDLAKTNETVFYDALRPFFAAARRTNKPAPSPKRSRGANRDYDPVKVREWAKTQGIELGERGRIPGNVIQAYQVGHAS